MFQAVLTEGVILKKIVEAIKDLVADVNIETSPTGISLQAMDSSHVALVSLNLNMEGFESYRSDRAMTLGLNMSNLAKVMKLAGNDDTITLRAEEEATKLTIEFQNKSKEME
jgi:proliferating cell nuclear antigen